MKDHQVGEDHSEKPFVRMEVKIYYDDDRKLEGGVPTSAKAFKFIQDMHLIERMNLLGATDLLTKTLDDLEEGKSE